MSESQELLRASLLAFMTFLQPTNAILNVLSLRNNCKTSGVFQLMEGRLNHIRFWNATLNPCNQQNHLNSHPSSAGSNIVIRDNQISLCKFRLMVRMEAVNSAILNSDFSRPPLYVLSGAPSSQINLNYSKIEEHNRLPILKDARNAIYHLHSFPLVLTWSSG